MTLTPFPTTLRTSVRPLRNPATAHPVALFPDRLAGLRHERNDALTVIRSYQPGKTGAHDVTPTTRLYRLRIGPRCYYRSADSTVVRFSALPTWAAKRKATRMAATCRIVRLEELASDYQYTEAAEDAEIAAAIADDVITPEEKSKIVTILQRQHARRTEITRELSIIADGAEMVRTLASTFAITPKVARKLREKGQDYLRLVVVNDDPVEAA